MKALTIRQPWASLIIAGIKTVENRSWPAAHRGLLAVHAGLGTDPEALKAHRGLLPPGPLPRGVILGTVNVTGCVRDSPSPWAEPGCWHWILKNPQPLAEPVPRTGRLGLWTVPDTALQAAASR